MPTTVRIERRPRCSSRLATFTAARKEALVEKIFGISSRNSTTGLEKEVTDKWDGIERVEACCLRRKVLAGADGQISLKKMDG